MNNNNLIDCDVIIRWWLGRAKKIRLADAPRRMLPRESIPYREMTLRLVDEVLLAVNVRSAEHTVGCSRASESMCRSTGQRSAVQRENWERNDLAPLLRPPAFFIHTTPPERSIAVQLAATIGRAGNEEPSNRQWQLTSWPRRSIFSSCCRRLLSPGEARRGEARLVRCESSGVVCCRTHTVVVSGRTRVGK